MEKFNDPLENWLSSLKSQWRGWKGLDPLTRAIVKWGGGLLVLYGVARALDSLGP